MNQLTHNWWTVALRGVLAIVVGILAFFFPSVTLLVLITLFASFALLEGTFLIISGIRKRKETPRWGVLMLQGILSIGAGILALVAPLATAVALLYLIAFWAIASGIIEIAAAIRLRKEIEGEWMLIMDGILTILFGIGLVLVPSVGLLLTLWMIGGFKLVSGIILLILAFKLKRANHQVSTGGHHGTGRVGGNAIIIER